VNCVETPEQNELAFEQQLLSSGLCYDTSVQGPTINKDTYHVTSPETWDGHLCHNVCGLHSAGQPATVTDNAKHWSSFVSCVCPN